MELSQRLKRVLVWAAIVLGAMIAVGLLVRVLYPSDWRPVEAEVRSSQVVESGGRSAEWVVRLATTHEVAGQRYDASVDISRDRTPAGAEAEAVNWPPGRKLILHFNADDPASVSLAADGGREATIVLAVSLTPLFVGLVGLIGTLVRRRLATRAGAR